MPPPAAGTPRRAGGGRAGCGSGSTTSSPTRKRRADASSVRQPPRPRPTRRGPGGPAGWRAPRPRRPGPARPPTTTRRPSRSGWAAGWRRPSRNAAMLRERTTQDVIRSQRAGQDELPPRPAKRPPSPSASARAEADDIRARAPSAARGRAQRGGRARQAAATRSPRSFPSLSGVIQALAVPAADGPSDDRQGGADTPPDHDTQPPPGRGPPMRRDPATVPRDAAWLRAGGGRPLRPPTWPPAPRCRAACSMGGGPVAPASGGAARRRSLAGRSTPCPSPTSASGSARSWRWPTEEPRS